MGDDDTKIRSGETATEEKPPMRYAEDGIDLGEYLSILRRNGWKIVLFSLAVGLVTLLVMFLLPNIYQATAVLTPHWRKRGRTPPWGSLPRSAYDIGSPSKVEDLETLFQSNDLTARVFRKYNLWPIVLPDKFDPGDGEDEASVGRTVYSVARRDRGRPATGTPSESRRIACVFPPTRRPARFPSPSNLRPRKVPPNIVKYYLDEGKSRLQEEALDRAVKNKKFIEEQIGKTVDALTRDRLYSLYGQEVEREMMARNREQFGFRVVDSPRVSDRKLKPHRVRTSIASAVISFFVLCFYLGLKKRRAINTPPPVKSRSSSFSSSVEHLPAILSEY